MPEAAGMRGSWGGKECGEEGPGHIMPLYGFWLLPWVDGELSEAPKKRRTGFFWLLCKQTLGDRAQGDGQKEQSGGCGCHLGKR